MVAFTVRQEGRARVLLLLGISRDDKLQLEQGRPVAFPGEQAELPGVDIAMFMGETNESIVRKLEREGLPIGPRI